METSQPSFQMVIFGGDLCLLHYFLSERIPHPTFSSFEDRRTVCLHRFIASLNKTSSCHDCRVQTLQPPPHFFTSPLPVFLLPWVTTLPVSRQPSRLFCTPLSLGFRAASCVLYNNLLAHRYRCQAYLITRWRWSFALNCCRLLCFRFSYATPIGTAGALGSQRVFIFPGKQSTDGGGALTLTFSQG